MMSQGSVTFRPGLSILKILDQDEWQITKDFASWSTAVTGSGSASAGARKCQANTSTTAASTARLRTTTAQGWSTGKDRAVLDWSKKIVIHGFFYHMAGTTNGIGRITFGKLTTDGVGACRTKVSA